MVEELKEVISDFERSATALSNVLYKFDLRDVPGCDKDLNSVDIGSKVKVAKFLLSVLLTGKCDV